MAAGGSIWEGRGPKFVGVMILRRGTSQASLGAIRIFEAGHGRRDLFQTPHDPQQLEVRNRRREEAWAREWGRDPTVEPTGLAMYAPGPDVNRHNREWDSLFGAESFWWVW